MTKINRLSPITFVLAITACNPLPPVTPDETPACPCPDFATQDHPEDPGERPGEWCLAKSRTGQWMPAEEHPACVREARERAGGERK